MLDVFVSVLHIITTPLLPHFLIHNSLNVPNGRSQNSSDNVSNYLHIQFILINPELPPDFITHPRQALFMDVLQYNGIFDLWSNEIKIYSTT